jgi:hypothetical protein
MTTARREAGPPNEEELHDQDPEAGRISARHVLVLSYLGAVGALLAGIGAVLAAVLK